MEETARMMVKTPMIQAQMEILKEAAVLAAEAVQGEEAVPADPAALGETAVEMAGMTELSENGG